MSDLFFIIVTTIIFCGMYVVITCVVGRLMNKSKDMAEFFINAWTVGMVLFSCFGTLIYKIYLMG